MTAFRSSTSAAPLMSALAPAMFVLLWSTGFIASKAGLPYVEPFTFLTLRFVLVAALMAPLALALGTRWPRRPADWGHQAVAGLLMHGFYLGGVFASIHAGVPAGVSAIIVGLQPVLTAAVAGPVLGERVSARQWLGIACGFAGVVLVLWNRLGLGEAPLWGYGLSGLALLGITAGTLYQKRFGGGTDLRSAMIIQYAATAVPMAGLALAFETMRIDWTPDFVAALAWLVLVLSVGAVMLLYVLIRRGAASRVASLFFLVPPITAAMGYALFGETLGLLALAGLGLVAAGVALVQKG